MTDPEPEAAPHAPCPKPPPLDRHSLPDNRQRRRVHVFLRWICNIFCGKPQPTYVSPHSSRSRQPGPAPGVLARLPASPDLEKLTVAELMHPAHEMVYLSAAHTDQHNLDTIQRTRFSRYPFFADDGETLLGMVHFKDLFPVGEHGVDFPAILRKALIVPPDTLVPDLFGRFCQGESHFALVGYPGEHPEGFLTIDNLLGAMIGEIRDEFRHDGGSWDRMDDGSLLGKGSMSLFSLKRALSIELPELNVDSVGGLVMEQLGRLPNEGEHIPFQHFDIVIQRMQGPRILLLKVIPPARTLHKTPQRESQS